MTRLRASFLWCLLAVFFGLLQFWCMFVIAALDQKSPLDVWRLIRDCGVLFFSTALATTFALDYGFVHRYESLGDRGLYILFPLIIIISSILLYAICYLGHPKFWPVTLVQIAVGLATCAYAITIKRRHFSGHFPE